jgi:predicted transcriptional regulator
MLQLMMQAQMYGGDIGSLFSQVYDLQHMQELEAQQEQEMIGKAIQESLKDNPNPDVVTYEQLQELEDKIGFVSKGFTNAEIQRIHTKMFTSTNEDCSICLDEIKMGSLIKTLSCGHSFHPICIDQGLKNTKKCPCCMEEHQISS